MDLTDDLQAVRDFLPCATPASWYAAAIDNLQILLVDHANCEKKAAATAMNLMYRHVSNPELMVIMARLAREELLHFQQVVELMAQRKIPYLRLGPSRYAAGLRELIDSNSEYQLVDTLLSGAIVEARSSERFAGLIPLLDEELARFYRSLLRSEIRHYQDYLAMAQRFAKGDISARLQRFLVREKELVLQSDAQFRFHSGAPANECGPIPSVAGR